MAALTVQDLITDALENLVAVPAGDTPATADLTKGLAVLKRMVDASNINRGNIAAERLDTWSLVSGQQAYTIGVDPAAILTPNFAAVRPVRIVRANLLLVSGSSTTRQPLELPDTKQWAAKSFLAASGNPSQLYNDGAYPLSTYRFYPIPSQVYQFETYTWQQFAQAALADKLAIPPGYYEFWLYGLQIRLAEAYGKEPRATTIQLFGEARAVVQSLNCQSPRMRTDGGLGGGNDGLYNWLSGQTED